MFVHVLACISTYLHVFLLSVGEKGWYKERECEKKRVGKGGVNWLLRFDFLFLSNFMEAKDLFWFEYEMSVFWEILLSNDDDD